MRSMEKEAVEKKVVYSETIAGQDIDAEHKALLESMERLEEENRIIGSTLNRVEEETAMLRELFNNANKELTNLKKPALLVAEVVSMIGDKAIIRLPNANKFYFYAT